MSYTLAVENGDLFVNARGSGDMISGRDKLSQDFAETLLTVYDPSTDNGSRLGRIVVGAGASKSFVTSELHECSSRLQRKQQQDPACTPDERLASVSRVEVEVKGRDCYFDMALRTSSGQTLVIQDGIQLRVPKLGHLNTKLGN